MDTQVLRVAAWREQKRKAGYQPLTVWLKAEVKHLIEDLASQSRQEIAEVVSEAIRVYAGQHRSPVPWSTSMPRRSGASSPSTSRTTLIAVWYTRRCRRRHSPGSPRSARRC